MPTVQSGMDKYISVFFILMIRMCIAKSRVQIERGPLSINYHQFNLVKKIRNQKEIKKHFIPFRSHSTSKQ